MELNWSTFILEIINFLILVWILKHFLYKPVLNIITRRKAAIEQTLNNAKEMHESAETLRKQFEHRLRDWEREKQKARDHLKKEIDQERARLMQELQETLAKERERKRVSEERQLQTVIDKAEESAFINGAQFASRLIEAVAGPELETRLVDLVIDDLNLLSPERINQLRTSWEETSREIHVTSAYPLPDPQRDNLEKALSNVTGQPLSFHYDQDRELLAGLSISIGAWCLGANLRDELKGFADLAHDS